MTLNINSKSGLITLKAAFVASALALAGFVGGTGPAQAHDINFGITIGKDGKPRFKAGYYGGHYHAPRVYRDRVERRYCTPKRAKRKARNAGVRHARVRHINGRGGMVLTGRYYGDPVFVRVNRKCNVKRIFYR